jgi:predicted nuclease of predicted toxin-antitoxin system
VIQFRIDENLSPRLVETANAFGYNAYHVAHRGWSSLKDPQLLQRVLAEDLTVVSNNRIDFRPLLGRQEIHPGLVVILPNVRRERQVELFTAALLSIRDHSPPLDMVNTVLEVDTRGTVMMYRMPNTS